MKKKSIQDAVIAAWENEKMNIHPFKLLLRGMSLFYRLAILVRNILFDTGLLRQKKVPCRVVGVGNITVGGTGKTPMVIYLANLLNSKGFRPVVLSRGYRGKTKAPINIVSDGRRILMKPEDCGDEPALIAKRLPGIPVLTGPRRALTAGVAIEQFGADVLVLDDAFQYRQLARDVDVVLLDADRPLGNGWVLPAGPLREPGSSLKRADLIIRTGLGDRVTAISTTTPQYRARHQAVALIDGASGRELPLQSLLGRRVCAFAGIAKPGAFKQILAGLGARTVAFLPFPDHHDYSREDIREIQNRARQEQADTIVTTEKDGVKLNRFHMFLEEVDFLQVEMVFQGGEDEFIASLMDKLGQAQ
ncbi:MAG: tetraacyldisaccharide 4'-kinase [Syntrophales bacterium]|jgi:tetraacyldisaccharide 4'-kinase|nr:tetraacyldisaccharide 4'-kinase [Syntrophales bacterium]